MVSDLRISSEPLAAASKAPAGSIDLYLGFDLLGAASDKNLVTAAPDRTVAVVSTSAVPTGRMVIDAERALPGAGRPARPHRRASRAPSTTSTSTPSSCPSASSTIT